MLGSFSVSSPIAVSLECPFICTAVSPMHHEGPMERILGNKKPLPFSINGGTPTIRVRAHRSPCCFLYAKVARNLGFSAIWRKTRVVGLPGKYCGQDKISLFVTLCFGF